MLIADNSKLRNEDYTRELVEDLQSTLTKYDLTNMEAIYVCQVMIANIIGRSDAGTREDKIRLAMKVSGPMVSMVAEIAGNTEYSGRVQ